MTSNEYAWKILLSWSLAIAASAQELVGAVGDFRQMQLEDIYRAAPLVAPVEFNDLGAKLQRRWDFDDGSRAGFTAIPAQDAKVEGGILAFTAGAPTVKLGWGNWDNKQAESGAVKIWDGRNIVIAMRVRQSAAESQWQLDLRAAGAQGGDRRGPRSAAVMTLKGADWQEARFEMDMPGADGFELTITGPADNRIEIDELRILRRCARGYWRREFTMPPGAKAWRAIIAAPPATADIYINGQPVTWSPTERYITDCLVFSREITAQLHAGVNCLAYALREDCLNLNPMIYLQGQVILASGETILLDSDASWRCSAAPPPADWTNPGFDDAGWSNAIPSVGQSGASGLVKLYQGAAGSMVLRPEWPLPAYDGRILLEHPSKRRLYYQDDQPVVVNVRLPAGLAERRPSIAWTLRAVGGPYNMDETVLHQGATADFERQDDSIVLALDCGRLEQGIYTVETELHADGALLEFRYREPLAVVGRIIMPEVAGTSYEDGMELELEDVIDFTNPNDSHRWIEVLLSKKEDVPGTLLDAPPRIIRRPDLVYRELQHQFSVLAYECALRYPGDWYLMTLEYPDDAWRGIAVTVSHAETAPREKAGMTPAAFTIGSAAVVTGGKFPVSNRMRELKFLVRAQAGKTGVELWNWLSGGGRAAAARLRIEHVKNTVLPALKSAQSGERFMGLSPESLRWGRMMFGFNSPGQLYLRWKIDVPGSRIYRLACNFDAVRHLTQYLRFCGLNFHTLGAYQYSEVNNSYSLPQRVACSQLPVDINDIALRVFEANGIAAINWVEFWENRGMSALYMKSASQVAAGEDTIKQVLADGSQTTIANFLHPKVEELFLGIVDDLALQFSDSPSWKGVGTLPLPHPAGLGPGFMSPMNAPLDACYSDTTIRLFEKETGIKIPGAGAGRFAERRAFLTAPDMRARWIDWRCAKQRDITVKTRDVLRRHRRDLWTIQVNYTTPGRIGQWLGGESSYREINRLYGFDAALYKDLQDIWYGRCVYTSADCSQALDAHRVSMDAAADYDAPRNRMAFIRTAWLEDHLYVPAVANWPYAGLEVTQYPRYTGDFCKEDFTQTMIANDPELILSGWADCGGEQTGQEQQVREVARVVTALPGEQLPLVLNTGFDSNLAIRAGRSKDRYWFYTANPGFWRVRGQIALAGARAAYDAASGAQIKTSTRDGKLHVPVELGPFGMQAFVADPPEAEVAAWITEDLTGADREFLRECMAYARTALENPALAACFAPHEIACIARTLWAAQQAAQGGQYASVWAGLQGYNFQHIISSRDYRAKLDEPVLSQPQPSLTAVRADPSATPEDILSSAFWDGIPGSRDFKPVSRQLAPLPGRPAAECEIKAAYDNGSLYLAFTGADCDVKALQAQAQNTAELYKLYDDCLDIFVAPFSDNATRVYQFALNPAGTPRLARCYDANGRGAPFAGEWMSKIIVEKDRWTAICALPFAALEAQPAAGGVWRVNFRRRHRQFILPESVWSLVVSSYTSDVEKFGTLRFM